MAESGKIQSSQVIEDNLFKNTIESASQLETQLTTLLTGLKAVSVESANYLKISKAPKSSKEINSVTNALIKHEKVLQQIAITEEKLQKVKTESEKTNRAAEQTSKAALQTDNLRLKLAKERENAIKREQKEQEKLNSEYAKGSKRLAEIQKELKELVFTGKENTSQFKNLNKEFTELHAKVTKAEQSVGQFSRNVGNYKSGYDGLAFSITQVGRELPSLAYGFGTFAAAISNNLPMVFDEISKVKDEIKLLNQQGKETPTLFKRIVSSMLSWQTVMSVGLTLLVVFSKEIVAMIQNLFDSESAFKRSREAQQEFTDSYLKNLGELYEAQLDLLVLEGKITEEKANQLRRDREINNEKLRENQRFYTEVLTLAKNAGVEASKVMSGINDTTVRYAPETKKQTISTGTMYAQGTTVEVADEDAIEFNKKLRKLKEDHDKLLLILDEKAKLKTLITQKEYNNRSIKSQKEYNLQFIDAAIQMHDELLGAKARTEIQQLQEEVTLKGRELELKYDTDKKILDSIISSAKSTKEEKEKANKDLLLLDKYDKQVRIDLQNYYNEKEKDILLKQKEELIKLEEEKQESLRKKRQEEYDKELSLLETHLIELNTLKLKGFDVDKEIIDKELEIAKYKLNKVLENTKATYTEVRRAMAEYDKTLAEILKNDESKKIVEERINNYQRILSFLQQELDAEYNLRQSALDRQIQQREKAAERQFELAKNGLDNQLAYEQQKIAKDNLKKLDLEKKHAKEKEAIQLAQAYMSAYNAELNQPNSNPSQASLKALKNVLIAKGIGKALASFFDGTEDTGKGGNMDNRGGFLSILHPNERVLTAEQNKKIGRSNISNEKLTDIAVRFNRGMLVERPKENLFKDRTAEYIKENVIDSTTNKLLREIADKPTQYVGVDTFGNLLEKVYQRGRTDVIVHKQKRRL